MNKKDTIVYSIMTSVCVFVFLKLANFQKPNYDKCEKCHEWDRGCSTATPQSDNWRFNFRQRCVTNNNESFRPIARTNSENARFG